MRRVLLLCLLPALAQAAPPSAGRETFSYIGAGGISCGTYIQRVSTPDGKASYGAYMMGYITGMNNARIRQTSADYEGLMAALLQYCTANPLKLYLDGLNALDRSLGAGGYAMKYDNGLPKAPPVP